ncbi:MAG: hypothetical protein D6729_01795 [Deltaproteobacteria bacterium]|nr:MAG: hypothetical protein D6729_01795 [Deltaproteobacteria bacterium]
MHDASHDAADAVLHDAPTRLKPRLSSAERELVRRFLRGEVTFAQLEGFTVEEARRIAKMGHRLYEEGRYDEARILFEGLAAINPLDAYAHQVLGAIAECTGDIETARRHFDVCLSLDPKNVWVLVRRGELRLKHGDAKGGLEDLGCALEVDPEGRSPAARRAALFVAVLARAARQAGAGNEEAVRREPPEV